MAKANIPGNFNLSAYDQCGQWAAAEWAGFIESRQFYHHLLGVRYKDRLSKLAKYEDKLSAWIGDDEDFRKQHLANCDSVTSSLSNLWETGEFNFTRLPQVPSSSVNPLSVGGAAKIHVSFLKSAEGENSGFLTKKQVSILLNRYMPPKDPKAFWTEYLKIFWNEKKDFEHIASQPYGCADLVRIDLSVPDKTLIEDFTRHIKDLRENSYRQSNEATFSKKSFRSGADLKCLHILI